MLAGNLTTLAHVKEWLGITDDSSDALLARLITSASRVILNYCNRQGFAAREYDDIYNGYGQNFMVLRQWPVIKLNELQFSGYVMKQPAQGNPPNNGWVLTNGVGDSAAGGAQTVTLFGGYRFPSGRNSVRALYRAGYERVEEHVVPADPHEVTTDVTWLENTSVSIGATLLTKVASNPGPMQYTVSDVGLYKFNAAQEGATIIIVYSYVPPDVEQACWELVGLRFKEKDRIGIQSKSLGGQETISYFKGNMPADVVSILSQYMRVAPV